MHLKSLYIQAVCGSDLAFDLFLYFIWVNPDSPVPLLAAQHPGWCR